jgi:predicted regulator of amino acid metabolism with ACT domain
MAKKEERNAELAARVKKVASITGVSRRMVYMVIKGERANEEVTRAYMMLYEGENKLLEAVKRLAPSFATLDELDVQFVKEVA